MTFIIELKNHQKTKMWTFDKSKDALALQKLLDEGNRKGYLDLLAKLTEEKEPSRQFTRTKGIIYEMVDGGETIDVPIRFEVKGSVITWYFISRMDRTHQSFRDLVFNTAAKAHTYVKNGCETYYRGTNSLHLKAMHLYAEESELNHNHYRTADDGPITPVEVYEHLMAFCAQGEGKVFIPTIEERDEIILRYALFWADFDLDIRYVIFSAMEGEGGIDRMHLQLKDIARAGKLSPDAADKQLDEFFDSEQGKNMFKLGDGISSRGGSFPDNDQRNQIKEVLKKDYRDLYKQLAPKEKVVFYQDIEEDPELELPKESTLSTGSSPRDDYINSPDQIFDEIDRMEYEAFAADLTKHCHSIEKKLLENLQFDDFRKGILLYHALRTAQEVQQLHPDTNLRFHSSLTTNEYIKKLIEELPSLQKGSTEDEIGPLLINRLIHWVQTASPELDEWVDWVKVNGSRGLGSELAQVRQATGAVDLRQAVPQGDRSKDSKIAEIDFDRVDLQKIFLPDIKKLEPGEEEIAAKLITRLKLEMEKARTENVKEVQLAKMAVIDTSISVLLGRTNLAALHSTMDKSKGWNDVGVGGTVKSSLENIVDEIYKLGMESTMQSTQIKANK